MQISFIQILAVTTPHKLWVSALKEIGSSSDQSKAVEANGLLFQVQSFPFIISLVLFDRILLCTKQLSHQLQSSEINLFRGTELVSATKSMLQCYRTDQH